MSKASISILTQAQEVIADRRARVDGPEGNFARIAAIWSVVFGDTVTTREVALCMIGLKFARECYSHWTDNLVDLCGYADCLALIEGDYDVEQDACQEDDDSDYQSFWAEADPYHAKREQRKAAALEDWTKGFKFDEATHAEVCSPAPWQGRRTWGCAQAGQPGQRYVFDLNAESYARCRQVAGKCACGKSEGDCDWPACFPPSE